MTKTARLIIVALIGSLMCACLHTEGRAARLDRALFELNEGLRWTRSGEVFARVHPESIEHIVEIHKDFGKDIKVSHYEIVRNQMFEHNTKAHVTVQFVWYRENEMVVHETVIEQQWEDVKGRWLLVAEEIVSGKPF